MDQLEFERYIVRTMLQGSFSHRRVVVPTAVLPDIRYDGDGHNLEKGKTEGRCKLEGCHKTHCIRLHVLEVQQTLHQKCFTAFRSVASSDEPMNSQDFYKFYANGSEWLQILVNFSDTSKNY